MKTRKPFISRIEPSTLKKVDDVVRRTPTYNSRNHFIEIAVNGLLLKEGFIREAKGDKKQ